jgi:uncharacterized repeat protein (TIGR03837 family)
MHFYHMHFKTMDIFCHVVDNYGDVGVVFRFAKEFRRANPQCRLRVFIDDLQALHRIHPDTDPGAFHQEHAGIVYIDSRALTRTAVQKIGTAEILVEAFACQIPDIVLDVASKKRTYIINLDHLSAEKWVEGYHLKESLLGRGELRKYFFMPGFTKDTGGVIIDTDIENARPRLPENRGARINEFLKPFGVAADALEDSLFATIFTYEQRFDGLLEALAATSRSAFLFVFDRQSTEGMKLAVEARGAERLADSLYRTGNITIVYLPFLAQQAFDELVCLCDFNLVRGEDTFVRAILSEKPFIWHAYKQHDNYQMVKAKAFLEAMRPYFDDEGAYLSYQKLVMEFNDTSRGGSVTNEGYGEFIKNLDKIKHATEKMSYFIRNNCNLISHFSQFLEQLHHQIKPE